MIAAESMALDPRGFFPSDRWLIAVDARPQIIECAPRQALFVDEDEARFLYPHPPPPRQQLRGGGGRHQP